MINKECEHFEKAEHNDGSFECWRDNYIKCYRHCMSNCEYLTEYIIKLKAKALLKGMDV